MKRILTPQRLTTGTLSGWFKLNMAKALGQRSSHVLCLQAEGFLLPLPLQESLDFMMQFSWATTILAAK